MTTVCRPTPPASPVPLPAAQPSRIDYLDAARAFALVLGILFHASLSFLPFFIGWAVMDVSTSSLVAGFVIVSHSFRMELFFLLAGFFSCWTLRRVGAARFVRSRLVRIALPFVVGWFVLRPLLVSGWMMGSASLQGEVDVWAGLAAGFASLKTLPEGLLAGSHLWFLYYLLLITGLVLLVKAAKPLLGPWGRSLVAGIDAAMARVAGSALLLPALAAPTVMLLWYMRYWGVDTPEGSLRPQLPVLGVYTAFFVFGWLLGRQERLIDRFASTSWPRVFMVLAGVAITLSLASVERDPGHAHYGMARIAYLWGYALMMWSLVSVVLGLFRRWCGRPRPAIRYLADSAYWLYLVHLPIVVWLQVAVAEWSLPWMLKLPLVTVVTLGFCLLSYDLVVRSTIIGQILNGRRRPRVLWPWLLGRPAQQPLAC